MYYYLYRKECKPSVGKFPKKIPRIAVKPCRVVVSDIGIFYSPALSARFRRSISCPFAVTRAIAKISIARFNTSAGSIRMSSAIASTRFFVKPSISIVSILVLSPQIRLGQIPALSYRRGMSRCRRQPAPLSQIQRLRVACAKVPILACFLSTAAKYQRLLHSSRTFSPVRFASISSRSASRFFNSSGAPGCL